MLQLIDRTRVQKEKTIKNNQLKKAYSLEAKSPRAVIGKNP
jgi:hypothetical protein